MSISQLQTLKQHLTVPLVVINRELSEPIFHSVTFDQAGAVQMMMDHLIGYGHRKIACITGPLNRPSSQARFAGFQAALKQYAIPFNPNLVKNGHYLLQGGYDACQELLENQQPFSALLAFNDDMAFGAMKALSDAGIRVPEQVSVAGIDNSPMAGFSLPALTSIDLPIQEMTKYAIEIALKLASGKQCALSHQYKGKLLQRDSVVPFNSGENWLAS
jgi:DNA-binding LacI/PurR family transcriptional regulator